MLGQNPRDAEAIEHQRQLEERNVSIGENYRNLYWTRLVAIEGDNSVDNQRHSLGPDIVEALQALEEDNEINYNISEVLFDPVSFLEDHQNPKKDDYRLETEQLRAVAQSFSELRARLSFSGRS